MTLLRRAALVSAIAVALVSCGSELSQTAPPPEPVLFQLSFDADAVLTVADLTGNVANVLVAPDNVGMETRQQWPKLDPQRDDLLVVSWISGPCLTRQEMVVSAVDNGVSIDIFDGPVPEGVDSCTFLGIPRSVAIKFRTVPVNAAGQMHDGPWHGLP